MIITYKQIEQLNFGDGQTFEIYFLPLINFLRLCRRPSGYCSSYMCTGAAERSIPQAWELDQKRRVGEMEMWMTGFCNVPHANEDTNAAMEPYHADMNEVHSEG